jgi:hypothetical protein
MILTGGDHWVVHAGRVEIGVLPLAAWANFESGWTGLDWPGLADGSDSWGLRLTRV